MYEHFGYWITSLKECLVLDPILMLLLQKSNFPLIVSLLTWQFVRCKPIFLVHSFRIKLWIKTNIHYKKNKNKEECFISLTFVSKAGLQWVWDLCRRNWELWRSWRRRHKLWPSPKSNRFLKKRKQSKHFG